MQFGTNTTDTSGKETLVQVPKRQMYTEMDKKRIKLETEKDSPMCDLREVP